MTVDARPILRRCLGRLGYTVNRRLPTSAFDCLLADVIHATGVNLVLDVGGNVGSYGTMLRRLGYHGSIVSFEPVTQTFAYLQRQAQTDPRWRAVRLGLGSRSTTAAITVTRGSGHSSLRAINAYQRELFPIDSQVIGSETIEIRTLDSLFGACAHDLEQPKVLLKLDTQGYDLEVLKGAEESLNHVVAIQAEMSVRPIYDGMPDYLETLSYLADRGFVLSGVFPVSYDWSALTFVEFDAVLRKVEPAP